MELQGCGWNQGWVSWSCGKLGLELGLGELGLGWGGLDLGLLIFRVGVGIRL